MSCSQAVKDKNKSYVKHAPAPMTNMVADMMGQRCL